MILKLIMKNIYVILFCPLLFACNSAEKLYDLCGEFKESTNVNGELFVDSIVTNYPSAIECDSSSLIIFSEGNKFINVFDIKDGNILASAGVKGRSAGEIVSSVFSGFCKKDSIISIYDPTMNRLNFYKYSNCDMTRVDYVNFIANKYTDNLFSRLHCMDNGYKIGYSVFDSKDILLLFDKEFQFIKMFGDLPLKNIQEFKGTIPAYVASYNNYFAYAIIDFGYIALYKISDNGDIVKEWDKYITKPLFTENNGKITYDDKNLDGFLNIKMTENYIYCNYSGKTYSEAISQNIYSKPNEIFVFDYNGNPVRKIVPNYPMFYFDVSKDDKYIYSYVEDHTGKIIKYTI